MHEPQQVGSGTIIKAGDLFEIARAAYERTRDASSDRTFLGQGGDPLIAIIFSAAALEAFINEAAGLASMHPAEPPPDLVGKVAAALEEIKKSDVVKEMEKSGGSPRFTIAGPVPPSVRIFADIVEEIEKSRGSIGLKFLLARAIFAGKAYDKGAPPYQDFDLLMELRSRLIHLKAGEDFDISPDGELRGKHPPIIGKLRSKNILVEVGEGPVAATIPWTWLVSTRAAARWACDTAAKMVASVIEVVPASELKKGLERFCSKSFRPVE